MHYLFKFFIVQSQIKTQGLEKSHTTYNTCSDILVCYNSEYSFVELQKFTKQRRKKQVYKPIFELKQMRA